MRDAGYNGTARHILERPRREKANGKYPSRKVIIKAAGSVKVKEWSWNDETDDADEESWEDLGFELHHEQIGWTEQCYMDKCRQEGSAKHGSYSPSPLRWSLTIREE